MIDEINNDIETLLLSKARINEELHFNMFAALQTLALECIVTDKLLQIRKQTLTNVTINRCQFTFVIDSCLVK